MEHVTLSYTEFSQQTKPPFTSEMSQPSLWRSFEVLRSLWFHSSFFENTLWLLNIAMGNCPFIDGLPMNSMVDLSMAMLVIIRGYIFRSFPSYKAPFFSGTDLETLGTQVPKSPGWALGRPWKYRPGHSASGGTIHRVSLGPGGESSTEGLDNSAESRWLWNYNLYCNWRWLEHEWMIFPFSWESYIIPTDSYFSEGLAATTNLYCNWRGSASSSCGFIWPMVIQIPYAKPNGLI